MPYRVIDLRFSPKLGRIDDEPLQRLLHGHAVSDAETYFYVQEGLPHLLVALHYRLADLGSPPGQGATASRRAPEPSSRPEPDPPPETQLDEDQHALFQLLRAWRTARCRVDAVPPYVLLTNAQLAQVAREKPESLAALGKIPGLGENRLERWGAELLQMIATGVVPSELPPTRKEVS